MENAVPEWIEQCEVHTVASFIFGHEFARSCSLIFFSRQQKEITTNPLPSIMVELELYVILSIL